MFKFNPCIKGEFMDAPEVKNDFKRADSHRHHESTDTFEIALRPAIAPAAWWAPAFAKTVDLAVLPRLGKPFCQRTAWPVCIRNAKEA